MAVVNFIFVYILTGFILSWVLLVLFKKDLHHRTLLYLAGYGMAPLLVSFTLNSLISSGGFIMALSIVFG